MPYVLLPQGRLARSLTHLRRLLTGAVRDPLLREDHSVAGRAVARARVAWAEWTAATLRGRPPPAARLAALEANVVRLDEAAYTAVGALFRTALEPVELYGLSRALRARA
jgi:hypothetical protein